MSKGGCVERVCGVLHIHTMCAKMLGGILFLRGDERLYSWAIDQLMMNCSDNMESHTGLA